MARDRRNEKLTCDSPQFIINATQPVNDRIFDASAFTTFLQQRIKVDGLTGNLGEKINVTNLGDGRIEVVAHQEFSGRYLKYLYVYTDLDEADGRLTVPQHQEVPQEAAAP